MQIITADLYDQYPDQLELLNVQFSNFGTKENFSGQVVTLKVYEDNTFVRKLLEENGSGKILVIDGGGSNRCALVGDNLAKLAIDNHWQGIIVYGCIRDSYVINKMPIAIKALGTCPVKSIKRNVGIVNESLCIQGTKIKTDQFIYADSDGVLLSDKNLITQNNVT